ncbi:MAG: phosphatase PAP2 family protein [Mycobacterium sp.]
MTALISVAVILFTAATITRGNRGLVLLATGLAGLLAALALSLNAEWCSAADTFVADWFDTHRTRRRDAEAGGVFGYIGRPLHVLVIAAISGTLLSLRARSVLPALLVTGGVGLGAAVEGTLKAVIGRTATTAPLEHYQHSYPSGHVTGAAALLGLIAVCLGAAAGRTSRTVLATAAVSGVVFVAFLALYTGAHTFSDVIGGMLLGGSIVALGAAALGAWDQRGHRVDGHAVIGREGSGRTQEPANSGGHYSGPRDRSRAGRPTASVPPAPTTPAAGPAARWG